MAASSFLTDLQNVALTKVLLAPASLTTSGNSSGVDMQLSDGPIHLILNVGTVSGTTPTLDAKLQESDDNSTGWTDIVENQNGGTITQVTASTNLQVISTNQRTKRYVRLNYTISGTTPSFATSALLLSAKKVQGSGSGYTIAPTV